MSNPVSVSVGPDPGEITTDEQGRHLNSGDYRKWLLPQTPVITRSPDPTSSSWTPRRVIVDWRKNLSRNGEEPPVDQALMDLARDMMPKKGQGNTEDGSSGQLNPILVRPLSDRLLEGKSGPADPGHKLAAYMLDYLAGKKSDDILSKYLARILSCAASATEDSSQPSDTIAGGVVNAPI